MTRLILESVDKTFRSGVLWSRQRTEAVRGVSLAVQSGQTVGVLGESGSGKTTLVRLASFLLRPSAGSVAVDGQDPWRLSSGARRALRRRVQVVFQEASDGLDPRQSVAEAVEEPS